MYAPLGVDLVVCCFTCMPPRRVYLGGGGYTYMVPWELIWEEVATPVCYKELIWEGMATPACCPGS